MEVLATPENVAYVAGIDANLAQPARRFAVSSRWEAAKNVIRTGECVPKDLGKSVCYICLAMAGPPMCERYLQLKNGTIEANE